MKQVTWAAAAINDLNEIKAYVAENYSAIVAEHTIADLVRAASWLTDFPSAGSPLGIKKWRKWRPRRGRHVLIYEPRAKNIHILRVRHERNDWRPVPRA